jgi:alanine-synthesizing transaminase
MKEFARLNRLPPYVFTRVNKIKMDARHAGEDIIDLGMGNPDMPTPKHIVDKLVEASRKGRNHRYSASMGITKLRVAISDWYKRRFDVDINPDTEAIVTIGAKEGISHLVAVTIRPGDVVFSPDPTYPIHPFSAIIAGGDVRSIPLGPDRDFFEDLIAATKQTWPRPKILVICFPHNPTTEVVDLAFFEKVVDYAKEHDILVIHDLAYADLVFDGYKAPSFLQVPGAKDVLRWQSRGCRSTSPHKELSRLWNLSAHSNCVHYCTERTSGLRQENSADIQVEARHSGKRAEQGRVDGEATQGDHVCLGKDPGALSRDGVC